MEPVGSVLRGLLEFPEAERANLPRERSRPLRFSREERERGRVDSREVRILRRAVAESRVVALAVDEEGPLEVVCALLRRARACRKVLVRASEAIFPSGKWVSGMASPPAAPIR